MGKNHHYVPQFYLRNFSCNQAKRQISLCNLAKLEFHSACSIKNQSCKDYFYDVDGDIESWLSNIENIAAAEISRIINHKPLEDEAILRVFIVLSHMRTEKSASLLVPALEEILTNLAITVANHEHVDAGKDLRAIINHPGLIALSEFDKIIEITHDLQLVVLQNTTTRHFITSDNPSILHNTFLEKINARASRGLGLRGAIMYMPLSPMYAIMLYDSETYDILLKKRNGALLLTDRYDIDALNSALFLYSGKVVYFDSDHMRHWIVRYHKRYNRFRSMHKSRLDLAILTESQDNGHKKYSVANNLKLEPIKGDTLFAFSRANVYAGISLPFLTVSSGVNIENALASPRRPYVTLLKT